MHSFVNLNSVSIIYTISSYHTHVIGKAHKKTKTYHHIKNKHLKKAVRISYNKYSRSKSEELYNTVDKAKRILFRKKAKKKTHSYETDRISSESIKAPEQVMIPMRMCIGRECTPVVKLGEHVRIGQRIGDTDDPDSVPIYSSMSGIVKEIEPMLCPNGEYTRSVIIENDMSYKAYSLPSHDESESLTADELVSSIREAGISGHGSDELPPHVKLRSSIGKADTLIIDGTDNELYVTSACRIMLENTDKVIGGIRLLLSILPNVKCFITISSTCGDAVNVINRIIGNDSRIKTVQLDPRYTVISDSQLIRSVMSEVDHDTDESKCLVLNAETVYRIYSGVISGKPMTTKLVTVSGSAITHPKNLRVPIGVSARQLVKGADGLKDESCTVILGDPMEGYVLSSLDVPITSAVNALTSVLDDEDRVGSSRECIRCGRCVDVCPSELMPLYIYKYALKGNYDKCYALNVSDCIECGACMFECPCELELTYTFQSVKARLNDKRSR